MKNLISLLATARLWRQQKAIIPAATTKYRRLGYLALIFSMATSGVAANPLPVEYFANLPDLSHIRLSASGTKIASFIRVAEHETRGMGVQVLDVTTAKSKIVLFTDNSNYFFNWLEWKDDRTLFVGIWEDKGEPDLILRYRRMLIIDTKTGEVRSPFKQRFLDEFRFEPPNMDTILSYLPNDPENILMTVPSSGKGWIGRSTVEKLNIVNQNTKTIQKPVSHLTGWKLDQQNRVRLASVDKDLNTTIMVKDIKSHKWTTFWTQDPNKSSSRNVYALGFDLDPNILFISDFHEGYRAVFSVDLNDKNQTRRLVYSKQNTDVIGKLVHSKVTNKAIGIRSLINNGIVFFDPEFSGLQTTIDKTLPDTRNLITSLTDDDSKFIVYSEGPKESGTYYLGERNPVKLKAVAYSYTKLPPEVLSVTKPVTYKSRDSEEVTAYLTLPNKNQPQEKLPTIIFPNGRVIPPFITEVKSRGLLTDNCC